MKTDELCRILSFSKGSVITIIHQLGYRKVSVQWVPRTLTDQNKETKKTIASEHFQHFQLDFHLFGPLNEAHQGIHFKDKEAVKTSARQWIMRQDLAFYRAGIHALVKRWTKTVEMDGDYIEK